VNALATIREQCTLAEAPSPVRAFVYFIVSGERIVYVGQTNNVGARMALHRSSAMPIDEVYWREVPVGDVLRYEGALIRALLPILCRRAPRYVGGDNAVLEEFGLPVHDDEADAVARAARVLRGRSLPRATPGLLNRPLTPGQRRRNRKLIGRQQFYRAALEAAAAIPKAA